MLETSSMPSSNEGIGVSCPIFLAIIWSMVVPARTSSPAVSLVSAPLSQVALLEAWPEPACLPLFSARLLKILKRSEERRVGKECRVRWSLYHYKKKEERRRERVEM